VIWIQMPIHFILSVANTVFMWEVTSIFDWGTVSPIPNRIVHARPWPRILTDFQRSKPGNVVMSVLWWIHTHTPIHNIKCVANTLFMLCMNVTSIVVGRRAWSIAYQHYSCPSMIKWYQTTDLLSSEQTIPLHYGWGCRTFQTASHIHVTYLYKVCWWYLQLLWMGIWLYTHTIPLPPQIFTQIWEDWLKSLSLVMYVFKPCHYAMGEAIPIPEYL
jgi:hypothetical protein